MKGFYEKSAERKKKLAKELNVSFDDLLTRMDGRIEWLCEHGVGHTVWFPRGSDSVHGCDGCCRELKKVKK
jgi:hypothetical protein